MRRILVIRAVTAVAVLGLAPAAFAHVTVNPSDAKQGGRVPRHPDRRQRRYR
jgi:uncharacterized protein YcnI